MTSEIRTNSITSRAGMSTVTMTDSGPMFSGITTFVDNSGFTFGVGGGTSIFTPATNVLTFGTNNTEKIRIDASGHMHGVGVITATHFYGDGSNLTGISAGTSLSGSTNNTVCTVTGANAINGETNLIFDGNKLGVNRSGTLQYGISLAASAIDNNRIGWHDSSNKRAAIGIDDSDDSLNFYTGTSDTKRAKFQSDGTFRFYYSIYGGDSKPIYLGNSNDLTLLHDGTDCRIRYNHTVGSLKFQDNSNANKLVIDPSGRIGVGVVPTAQYAHNLIQIGHQATLGANAALSATGQTFLTHNLYFDTGGTFRVFNTSNANEGAIFRLVDGQLLFSNSAATTGTPTVTERLRIDTSGNLFLRSASANYLVMGSSGDATSGGVTNNMNWIRGNQTNTQYNTAGGFHGFEVSGSEKLRITSSAVTINGTTDGVLNLNTTDSRGSFIRFQQAGSSKCWVGSGQGMGLGSATDLGLRATSHLRIHTGAEEHVFISDTGYISAKGEAGNWVYGNHPSNYAFHQFSSSKNGDWMMQFRQEHHNGLGFVMRVSNNGNNEAIALYRENTSTYGFKVYQNGNVQNSNNSYGSLSDVSLKENIVDANSQWDDIKAIKVRNFNLKSDADKVKMLGVVAQELETVSPKLVFEDKEGVKGVHYSVLYMKAIKALQEAMTKIETLEQDNIALRARVTNLEGN